MPVARKVWQPIAIAITALEARRRTMRQRSPRNIGLTESCAAFPITERNKRPLTVVRNTSRLDVGVQIFFELVVARHLVELTAFFMQTQPLEFFLRVVILNGKRDDSTDAGEGIRHHGNDGAVAQTHDG